MNDDFSKLVCLLNYSPSSRACCRMLISMTACSFGRWKEEEKKICEVVEWKDDEVDVGDTVRQVTQISEKFSRIFERGIADTLYSWAGSRQHRAALTDTL